MDHLAPHRWLLAAAGLLLIVCLAFVFVHPLRINHDVTLHLLSATHILQGGTPYVDFFNINFPMIFYLDTIPVLLARLFGASVILVFNLGVVALVGLSAGGMVAITARYDEPHIGSKLAFGVVATSLIIIMMNELGQREHLFMLLYLPFLLVRWYEWREREVPPAMSIPLGVIGAIGVCIKPFFALPVIAVEVYWLLNRRMHWRMLLTPGAIAFGSVGALYLLALALMPAFHTQLGRTLAGYATARGSAPPLELLFSAEMTLLIILAGFILARRRANAQQRLIVWLGVLCEGALIAYALQGRGFAYQLIPAMMAAGLMIVLALFPEQRAKPEARPWLNGARVLAVAWVAFAFFQPADLLQMRTNMVSEPELVEVINAETQPDDALLVLTPFPPTFKAALQAGRPSAARYLPTMPVLFEIPRDIPREEQYQTVTPWIEEFLTITQADIETAPPELIVVSSEPTCPACPPNFNLHTYFSSIGFLAEVVYPVYMRFGEVDERLMVYQHVGAPNSAMQTPVNFGSGQTLTAWEMPGRQSVRPCETLTLQTWWQTNATTGGDFSLSAVVSRDGSVIGQQDGPPANIDTSNWAEGGHYVDERSIGIACDVAPGDYDLLLTLYEPNTGENLPVELETGQPVGVYFFVTTVTVME